MRIFITLTAFFAVWGIAFSATIYVPDNYATIQGAITAASNGDEVIVRPGAYLENIDFLGKAITLKSEHGPDVTTIYGTASNQCVVRFDDGEGPDSVLEGFLIMNGQDSGIVCRSSPTIRNNIIYRCRGDAGGGIRCIDSEAVISKTIITQCEARGPSWDFGGGIYCRASAVTITGCEIYDNRADSGSGNAYGGGIYCYESAATISNNLISQNRCWSEAAYYNDATSAGGGLYIIGNPAPMVSNNTISYNSLETGNCLEGITKGGGIYCSDTSVTIVGNHIYSNRTVSGDDNRGGGIYCVEYDDEPVVTISRNRIFDNRSVRGGGIFSDDCLSNIEDNHIFDNRATEGGGIALSGYWGISASGCNISRNAVYENNAGAGSGICSAGWFHVITNNTIFSNYGPYSNSGGGGIKVYGYYQTITNNTIFRNTAPRGGGLWFGYGTHDVTNNIVWDNESTLLSGDEIWVDPGSPPPYVKHCNVKGGWSGTGNIDAAPVWADPVNGDFHLNWDSPCKDAGDANAPGLPSIDKEGDPRMAGAGVDMGADEFYPHLYRRGEVLPGATVDFHVVGEPGEPVKVALGAKVIDPPFPTPHGDLYIWPLVASWPIGTVPGSGIRILPATVPLGWSAGEEYPFQAQVGLWGNPDTILTNLEVLIVE